MAQSDPLPDNSVAVQASVHDSLPCYAPLTGTSCPAGGASAAAGALAAVPKDIPTFWLEYSVAAASLSC